MTMILQYGVCCFFLLEEWILLVEDPPAEPIEVINKKKSIQVTTARSFVPVRTVLYFSTRKM